MAQKKSAASKRKTSASRKKSTSEGASSEIRKEMHAAKEGRRKSPEQAIAIGLSKARRAGKSVPAPKKGKTSAATRKKAAADTKAGQRKRARTKKTGRAAASKKS